MKWTRWLELTGLILAVATGLCTAGVLVFKGGAVVNQVNQHENRLMKIEASGSPPIAEHIKLDDERSSNLKERMGKVEVAVAAMAQMQIELGKISAKLDILANPPKIINGYNK